MKYFVYFSNSGNGDFLAEHLKEFGYQIIKVEPTKPLKKMNFFRILKYGGQAMENKKMPIKDIDLLLKENDEVVIGSPIWNDRLSTPINSLLANFSFDKNKTRFILYPAGKDTSKSLKQIKNLGFELTPTVIPYPKKYQKESIALLESFK